jgi:hypothetical protein
MTRSGEPHDPDDDDVPDADGTPIPDQFPDANAFDDDEDATSDDPSDEHDPFVWGALSDAVSDSSGFFSCAGEDDRPGKGRAFVVWSYTPRLKLRWIAEDLHFDAVTTRLAVTRQDRVAVWSPRKYRATLLSGRDGGLRDKVGGREPKGATAPILDTTDAGDLVSDRDFSWLLLTHDRLIRFDRHGNGVPTWRRRGLLARMIPERVPPLYTWRDDDRHALRGSPVHPSLIARPAALFTHSTHLTIGWDKKIYVLVSTPGHQAIACYDAEGTRVWDLPLDAIGVPRPQRVGVDKDGNVHLIAATPHKRVELVQIGDRGKRVRTVLADWRDAGTRASLGTEEKLAVAPSGRLALFGPNGCARLYEPDGTLMYATSPSERAVMDAHRKRLERLGAGASDD